jgi:hypothetical protein
MPTLTEFPLFMELPTDIIRHGVASLLSLQDYHELSKTSKAVRDITMCVPHKNPQQCILAKLDQGLKDGSAYVDSWARHGDDPIPSYITTALRKYEASMWLLSAIFTQETDQARWPRCVLSGPVKRWCPIGAYMKKFVDVERAWMNFLDKFVRWVEDMPGLRDLGHEYLLDSFLLERIKYSPGHLGVGHLAVGVVATPDDTMDCHPYKVVGPRERIWDHSSARALEEACMRTHRVFVSKRPRAPRLAVHLEEAYETVWPVVSVRNGRHFPPLPVRWRYVGFEQEDLAADDFSDGEGGDGGGGVREVPALLPPLREIIDLTADNDNGSGSLTRPLMF